MNIKEKLNLDFIAARKSHQKAEAEVLTMVRTAIRYKEIEKKSELTDSDLIAIISHEIKQRKDSVAQYTAGKRDDLAAKEKKEIDILMHYMPAQLPETEIKQVIKKAVDQVGASGPADMGKVMGLVMKDLKGKADGSLVQKLVRQTLVK
jgi:uncharacterized protein